MDTRVIFRSLDHKNYRLFFSGQAVSLIGTWMQMVAMSWLVYRLTNSAFLLGLVGFANQIPSLLLTPFTGVVADRFNRHKILIVTQTCAMVQALTLALLTLTNTARIEIVILLGFILGVINAFDGPARQSFVVEMVERREDLPNAIALNSFLFNGARLVGPSIAGVLIASIGEGGCFLVNGLSFIAVIAALLAMTTTYSLNKIEHPPFWYHFKEGLHYAYSDRRIRNILLQIAIVSIAGYSYSTLMPIVAKQVLHGGAHTLGYLLGAAGFGAVSGAIYMASRTSPKGVEKIIPFAPGLLGLSLIALSFSHLFPVSLVIMAGVGFSMMLQMSSSNTYLQTTVEDEKRGRVMSLYTLSFMGMAPFGSLASGTMAHHIGVLNTLMIGGVVCLLSSFIAFNLSRGVASKA
ncbi:MAG: MFS transporter [Chitinophagales bacterium]